jgi:hypothetical protein
MKTHARLAAAAIIALALPLPAAPQEADPRAPQTVTLKPHFTDQSKKIVIPKDTQVRPEIRDGLIALISSGYPEQTLYVRAASGEYVWGTDSYLNPLSNLYIGWGNSIDASRYFSGGALMTRRSKPDTSKPFIAYPNGTYREFPTGTKDAAGLPNDVKETFSFNEGYALVQRGDRDYDRRKDAKGRMAFVQYDNRTLSFIDKDGKSVFPQLTSKTDGRSVDMRVHPLRENRRAYYNAELKKYGYADAKGAIAIRPQFDRATGFSDGMAAVMNKDENGDEKWGFIDATGKMAVPATYRMQPGRFKEGLAAVRIGRDSDNYEMTYIDKAGKRVMESRPWGLSEFTDGFAWASSGDRLFVINREFKEVRDLTKALRGRKDSWMWINFPGGTRACASNGVGPGDIFAPDGTMLFTCDVDLHDVTDGGLMFCYFKDEPQLKGKNAELPCFINKDGEIVYYFEVGVEGYEGKKPVEIKGAAPAQQAKPAGK